MDKNPVSVTSMTVTIMWLNSLSKSIRFSIAIDSRGLFSTVESYNKDGTVRDSAEARLQPTDLMEWITDMSKLSLINGYMDHAIEEAEKGVTDIMPYEQYEMQKLTELAKAGFDMMLNSAAADVLGELLSL